MVICVCVSSNMAGESIFYGRLAGGLIVAMVNCRNGIVIPNNEEHIFKMGGSTSNHQFGLLVYKHH